MSSFDFTFFKLSELKIIKKERNLNSKIVRTIQKKCSRIYVCKALAKTVFVKLLGIFAVHGVKIICHGSIN